VQQWMRTSACFAESSELIASAMGHSARSLVPMTMARLSQARGTVRCQERLGGLLKYYHREAA
jgi:hypothetical protein